MDTAGRVRFESGRPYTREEIHAALGGSRRAALVTRGGSVVCLCLTREKNPRAPDAMAVGAGGRSVKLARALAEAGAAVPVFVRAARGGWVCAGDRRVRAVVVQPAAPPAEGAPPEASLVLELEPASVDRAATPDAAEA